MKRKKQNRGFSLLEIMVVVSIIGMLASLSIPLWSKATVATNINLCINKQRKIYDAVALYELEQRKTLQSIKSSGVSIRNTLVVAGYVAASLADNRNTFDCPSSTILDYDDYQLTYTGTALTGTTCTILPSTHVAK